MCGIHGGRKPPPTSGHSTACQIGCTCSRHRGGVFTPENSAALAQARSRRKHEKDAARLLVDPEYAEAERIRKREYMRRKQMDPEFVAREHERQKLHGRRYYLKHKFDLSLDQWDALLVAQSGLCYLCGDPMNPADVCVDHDHSCCSGNRSCGRCVRGLADRWCNQGLGQFRDDPALMSRVADAVEEANRRIRLIS